MWGTWLLYFLWSTGAFLIICMFPIILIALHTYVKSIFIGRMKFWNFWFFSLADIFPVTFTIYMWYCMLQNNVFIFIAQPCSFYEYILFIYYISFIYTNIFIAFFFKFNILNCLSNLYLLIWNMKCPQIVFD